jgi:hypothetical protein
VGVDLDDKRGKAFELALVRGAEDFREGFIDNHAEVQG